MIQASLLPDTMIEWGTDFVFLLAIVVGLLWVGKRVVGFFRRIEEEIEDE